MDNDVKLSAGDARAIADELDELGNSQADFNGATMGGIGARARVLQIRDRLRRLADVADGVSAA